MSARKPDAESVQHHVERVRKDLGNAIWRTNSTALQNLWRDLEKRLLRVKEESSHRPEVVISLVGETGSGKSTLLNALLDARVLPVGNMLACTAAICEVGYSDSQYYDAEIKFIPRKDWEREKALLLGDINEAENADKEEDGSGEGKESTTRIVREARRKLWTIYHTDEDSDFSDFDIRSLREPREVTAALNKGVESFESSDLEEFRKWVAQYLDAKHRFWPLVQVVRLRGPFPSLACGAKIVDLPGLNDPNEARERVTKRYLKTCQFVWIIFEIKRLLKRDIQDVMLSDDFERQVVMDGRVNALTFVGTASDLVDLESGREEFELGRSATEGDVIKARNRAVRKALKSQLKDISARLAARAGERERAQALAETFGRPKVYTVSSREYMRLAGLSQTHASGLETKEETEIPALKSHMQEICEAYGSRAQAVALHNQIDMIEDEVRRELHAQRLRLQRAGEAREAKGREVKSAVDTAHSFLKETLKHLEEGFVQDLEGNQKALRERLKRGTERGERDLQSALDRWSRMHWATLRAVVRRDGFFVGTTGTHDLAADIAEPVLDVITFAWVDFFEDQMSLTLEKWRERLFTEFKSSSDKLLAVITPSKISRSADQQDMLGVLNTTEKVLSEQLSQAKTAMKEKVDGDRRTLYERLPAQIQANMAPAFTRAAAEAGRGMKRRMVDILAVHARQVSGVMFEDSERAIVDGVRDLSDSLSRSYKEMTATAYNHFKIIAQNLTLVSHEIPTSQIDAALKALDDLEAALDSIAEDWREPVFA